MPSPYNLALVEVFYRNGHWNAAVSSKAGEFKKFSRRSYGTSDEAKLAAFDLITRLQFSGTQAE